MPNFLTKKILGAKDTAIGLRDALLWSMYNKGPLVRTLAKTLADKDPRILRRYNIERTSPPSALARSLLNRRADLLARTGFLRRMGVKKHFKRTHGTDMESFFRKK